MHRLALGRATFVLLSRGQRGEQDRDLWRASDALFPVAPASARPDPWRARLRGSCVAGAAWAEELGVGAGM
jgi:hypothetical protein